MDNTENVTPLQAACRTTNPTWLAAYVLLRAAIRSPEWQAAAVKDLGGLITVLDSQCARDLRWPLSETLGMLADAETLLLQDKDAKDAPKSGVIWLA